MTDPATDPATDPVTSTGTGGPPAPASPPVLTVVSPDATAEEIAALVAVFASLGAPAAPPRRRPSEWSAPHRQVRRTLPHGPGGWRSSSLPH